ncbi:MAG TPA: AMP-binding protein [Taishania sp.]|nr:AMP-binding protein [Taishania sp.]
MNLHYLTDNEQIQLEVASFVANWHSNSTNFSNKTSGSTGTPKLVEIKKVHAKASAVATINFLKLSKQSNALLCLNTKTIGGKMMLVRSILGEFNLYIVEPSANPLQDIDIPLDFIAIAPIQLHTILQQNPAKLKAIGTVIVGGGVISEESIQLLKQHAITVFQTFGMTETISHIALRKVGYQPDTSYHTLPGVTVSEENEQLIIDAPSIGVHKLKTNDRVIVHSPTCFDWLGRVDFVINSGGVKIQIEELEKELSHVIHFPFFIYKKADEKLGEKVVLIVEGTYQKEYTQKEFYRSLTNKYYIPKEIAFCGQIERTASDKINRISTFQKLNEQCFQKIL